MILCQKEVRPRQRSAAGATLARCGAVLALRWTCACVCVRVRAHSLRARRKFYSYYYYLNMVCRILCRNLCRNLCRDLATSPLFIGSALCRWLCRWLCRNLCRDFEMCAACSSGQSNRGAVQAVGSPIVAAIGRGAV